MTGIGREGPFFDIGAITTNLLRTSLAFRIRIGDCGQIRPFSWKDIWLTVDGTNQGSSASVQYLSPTSFMTSQQRMSSRNYTPLEVSSLGNDMTFDLHVVSRVQREAAARAIIRSHQHRLGADDWDPTKGLLHPTFFELNHTRVAAKDRESILRVTWKDICDAVSGNNA